MNKIEIYDYKAIENGDFNNKFEERMKFFKLTRQFLSRGGGGGVYGVVKSRANW